MPYSCLCPGLLDTETSAVKGETVDQREASVQREALSGRPVCAVQVISVDGLAAGDHVILVSTQEPYRQCYQSGLVVEADMKRGRVLLVGNIRRGEERVGSIQHITYS